MISVKAEVVALSGGCNCKYCLCVLVTYSNGSEPMVCVWR